MKQVKDAILNFFRTIAGYVLFYYLLQGYHYVSGVSPFVYILALLLFMMVLNVLSLLILKKVLNYDPAFMFQMPALPYALYRMAMELVFFIFLCTVFGGFHYLFLVIIGISYTFGVLRHYSRVHRRMIEGRRAERSRQ
jgi:hypothetical protein